MITETDRLSDALDLAATVWPENSGERTALLRRVIDAGIDVVIGELDERRTARITALDSVAGSLTGTWPAGWREELRGEWPA